MVEGRNPRIDTIHANFAHVDKNKNFMITEIKNKMVQEGKDFIHFQWFTILTFVLFPYKK